MGNPVTKDYVHFEDLEVGQNFDLGATKITKKMIIEFATEFDPFPFHIDEKAARESLLGGIAASGWQTGAIALKKLLESFPAQLASAGGVGFTDLKWKRPVMAGDTIGGTVTIHSLRRSKSRPEWGVMTLDFDITNQKSQTVMSMKLENLVDVRDPSATLKEAAQ